MKQLKIVDGFLLRQVAGEYVGVPSGAAARVFNGLVTLNETGAEIFRLLQGWTTREAVITAVAAGYDVTPETLAADVDELLAQFRELAILEEVEV